MEKRSELVALGERLLAARSRVRLTRRELAEAAKVPPRTIQNYEEGIVEPSALRLRRLADALDVRLDELLPPGE